jgi:hypothetical protein
MQCGPSCWIRSSIRHVVCHSRIASFCPRCVWHFVCVAFRSVAFASSSCDGPNGLLVRWIGIDHVWCNVSTGENDIATRNYSRLVRHTIDLLYHSINTPYRPLVAKPSTPTPSTATPTSATATPPSSASDDAEDKHAVRVLHALFLVRIFMEYFIEHDASLLLLHFSLPPSASDIELCNTSSNTATISIIDGVSTVSLSPVPEIAGTINI